MNQGIETELKKAAKSTNEPLWEKYVILRDRLMTNEYTRWTAGFPEGNDHGPGHIKRVLEKLGQLVGPDCVNKGLIGGHELYLAVMAVLYHDIGIMRKRSDHASVSAVLVGDEHNDYLINKYDREIIRQAVVSHSSDRDISVETKRNAPDVVIGAHLVRPALIAALVRLADELDEDYRRADPVLQKRADIPESSHFYWEFCRRISGIRPDRPKHEIQIDISFHDDDPGKIILLGGRRRLFVAAFAEKIAKMNTERRRVNAFLPESLRYDRIRTILRVGSGSQVEWGPKEFTWNDTAEWQDFRSAFPALFTVPIDKAINRSLDQMREQKFDSTRCNLADLAEIIPDLPQIQQLRIMYNQARLESLAARFARTEDVDRFLTAALSYLTDWVTHGKANGWEDAGQDSYNEVSRMARDGDLSMLLHHRWSAVERLVGEFQNALPNKQPEIYLGRSGSVAGTGTVETTEGQRPITPLQESNDTDSMDARSDQMLNVTATGIPADATAHDVAATVWQEPAEPAQPVILGDKGAIGMATLPAEGVAALHPETEQLPTGPATKEESRARSSQAPEASLRSEPRYLADHGAAASAATLSPHERSLRVLAEAVKQIVPSIFDDPRLRDKLLTDAESALLGINPVIDAVSAVAQKESQQPRRGDLQELDADLRDCREVVSQKLTKLRGKRSERAAEQLCSALAKETTGLLDAGKQALLYVT
jgi:hypothetical protein